MNIFNSLGSNYNLEYVIKSIYLRDQGSRKKLIQLLSDRYTGSVVLTYKGRTALSKSLEAAKIPEGSCIAITGFTCIAVVNAITELKLLPLYIDIDPKTLNFSSEELEKTIKGKNVRAVIIQNTLGFPCDIEGIQEICKKHNLILIEDLAHSIGTIYANGNEAGTVGDYTILSFSQDKVVDAVSGGALIIKNATNTAKNNLLQIEPSFQDKMYPLFTFIIRKTYSIKVGKLLHVVFKTARLLSDPMKNKNNIFSDWHGQLVLNQFQDIERVTSHRRLIANVYAKNLKPVMLLKNLTKSLSTSSCLRFPIFIKDREKLILFLRSKGIYISDIWYDAPVAPKKYFKQSNYATGSCPKSEKVAREILNLPTHINISEIQALELTQLINQWHI